MNISYKKFLSFLFPFLAFAFVMNLARVIATDSFSYVYLNWNLFLAFLPLLFLFIFEKVTSLFLKVIVFFGWLFFLPNTSYIITDFIHLRNVGVESFIWFDGFMIFSYAFVGVLIFAFNMYRIQKLIFFKKNFLKKFFLLILSLLISFGVYIGRYIRWNSWNVLTHPLELIQDMYMVITQHIADSNFILMILSFTLFTLIIDYSFSFLEKEKNQF